MLDSPWKKKLHSRVALSLVKVKQHVRRGAQPVRGGTESRRVRRWSLAVTHSTRSATRPGLTSGRAAAAAGRALRRGRQRGRRRQIRSQIRGGRRPLPDRHQGGGQSGAGRIWLDTCAYAGARKQREQSEAPRQEAHERLHGVGAGGEEEAGRPVPPPAQRGAQQDPGQTVEVCMTRRKKQCGHTAAHFLRSLCVKDTLRRGWTAKVGELWDWIGKNCASCCFSSNLTHNKS